MYQNEKVWNVRFSRFVRKSKRVKKATVFYREKEMSDTTDDELKPASRANPRVQQASETRVITRPVTIKTEFHHGSIVAIDSRFTGMAEFDDIKNPPILYGVVENLLRCDEEEVRKIKESQSYVTLVLSGHCEWRDKREMNTKRMIVEDEYLTEIIPNPANRNYNEVMDDEDIVRWFEKKPWGWVVKE